ncbi:hypothetical protein IMSAG249_00013 [Lachnospiraceae bacterium]|nr:hypothetical protein IMSAG249_00013 [Lachnospiraceae bacterium]
MAVRYLMMILTIPAKYGTALLSMWTILMLWRAVLSFRTIIILTDMKALEAADRSIQPGQCISRAVAASPWITDLSGTAIHPAVVAASSQRGNPR